jgi:diguanylate cyclase (GGDEF)-like protein/PAS domain S-box-containing protein
MIHSAGEPEAAPDDGRNEIEYCPRSGERAWLSIHAQQLFDSKDLPAYYVATLVDTTQRRQQEAAAQLAARAFESVGEGILIADRRARITQANPAAQAMLGETQPELVGRRLSRLIFYRGSDPEQIRRLIMSLREQEGWRGEIMARRNGGRGFSARVSVAPLATESGPGVAVFFGDLSKQKETLARLNYLATRDPLTGQRNRSALLRNLDESLAEAAKVGGQVRVLCLGVDNFQAVNASVGHSAGDDILVETARRLAPMLPKNAVLARVGGDKFAIMLPALNPEAPNDMVGLPELQARLSTPYSVAGRTLALTLSVGVAVGPADGASASELLNAAETAMDRAKRRGGNRLQSYSARLEEQPRNRLQLYGQLLRAMEKDEFELHYQPRLDAATGRMSGVEALIRWHSAELGTVSPAQFIPVAEDTGLIVPIGQWVLQQGLRQYAVWRDMGLDVGRLAVNLSMHQIYDSQLVPTVQRVLEQERLSPRSLEFEVTESAIADDPEHAVQVLGDLKRIGVKLAVDDFGTGYSSLSYLRLFAIDFLKIDKSFVDGVPDTSGDCAIVRAVIALAEALGARAVAEGVATPAQRKFLLEAGCHELQGFLLARPMPAAELAQFAANQQVCPLPHPQ